jgi:hypothetical protein
MEYPFFGLTDMGKQLNKFKDIYTEYKAFGRASIDEVISRLPDATRLLLKANFQPTSYIENRGDGNFVVNPLPAEVQLAPVFAILTGDFTGDALPDILLTGNDFGNEVREGRYDALNGLLLEGDGQGNFHALPMQESGIFIPGDGKSLVKLAAPDGSLLVVSGENRGPLGLFRSQVPYQSLALEPFDYAANIRLQDGRTYREEMCYGNSYLSQSSRRLWLPSSVDSVEVIAYGGDKRMVPMHKKE